MASAHIEAINQIEGAQVSAIYSSRPLDEAEVSNRWGHNIRTFTDLDEMLSYEHLDVVSVCSYPNQHLDHAVKVARAGKHLILEKPMALNWEDCLTISNEAKKAHIKTCVCFECRFSNQFQVTKAVIDEGLLGEIHYGEVDYYHGIGPWYGQFRWNTTKQAGGSSLLSAGCHALDALLFCMDSEVSEVMSYHSKSKSSVFSPYEYNTTSVVILKFANGATGKCASSIDCLQPYYFHTHLCGSEGSLLDNKFHSMKLKTSKDGWSDLAMKTLDSGDVSDHPYQAQFESFFEAIRNGKEMPLTSLDHAMKTFNVLFAADKSAELGKPVVLN